MIPVLISYLFVQMLVSTLKKKKKDMAFTPNLTVTSYLEKSLHDTKQRKKVKVMMSVKLFNKGIINPVYSFMSFPVFKMRSYIFLLRVK